jgi:tetratricopeptide (TPR) repeat protein
VREIGPVRGVPANVAQLAAAAYEQAAGRTLDQMVPTATVRLASKGLEALLDGTSGDDGLRNRLLLLRGRGQVELHASAPARADAVEALAVATAAGDARGVAAAQALLADVEFLAGDIDGAMAAFAGAVAGWRGIDDARGLAETQRAWGKACLVTGALDDAEGHLVEAQRLFADLGDCRGLAWVDQHRAWIAFMQGDIAVAQERLALAEAAFRELDDHGGLAWVRGLLAYVRFHQGRFAEAEVLASEVARDAARREEHWGRAMMIALQATLRLWTGAVVECITLSEEAQAIFRRLSDHFGETQAMGSLARALVATGRIDDARRVVEECRAVGAPYGLDAVTAIVAAGVAAHMGDGASARREALAALEGLGEAREAGYDARVALALGLLQLGQVAEAVDALDALPAMATGRPYGSAVGALVHAADGRPDDARAAAAAALTAEGASYLDRLLALVASGLVGGDEAGDGTRSALDEAADVALGAGDVVAQAVVQAAMAEWAAARGDPDAARWRSEALESFDALGIDPTGWLTAVGLAARAMEPAP